MTHNWKVKVVRVQRPSEIEDAVNEALQSLPLAPDNQPIITIDRHIIYILYRDTAPVTLYVPKWKLYRCIRDTDYLYITTGNYYWGFTRTGNKITVRNLDDERPLTALYEADCFEEVPIPDGFGTYICIDDGGGNDQHLLNGKLYFGKVLQVDNGGQLLHVISPRTATVSAYENHFYRPDRFKEVKP